MFWATPARSVSPHHLNLLRHTLRRLVERYACLRFLAPAELEVVEKFVKWVLKASSGASLPSCELSKNCPEQFLRVDV